MLRLVPNTIRGQLIAGTVLLQCLLVGIFVGYIYRQQSTQERARTEQRLVYQVHVMADAASEELADEHLMTLESIMAVLPSSPTIRSARITDFSGNVLAYGDRKGPSSYTPLSALELAQLHAPYRSHVFIGKHNAPEVVAPVWVDGTPAALAWIVPDMTEDDRALRDLLNSALLFGLLAITANAVVSLLLARTITQPLNGLLRGTQLLIRNPEIKNVFPIRTTSTNEAGVLTHTFNSMVAALNEQRAGLNDTLALLDSMLANAPIGFAFFDRSLRYVRVNQFMANMNQLPISRHLGRPILEVFPTEEARRMASIIQQVFATGEPVRDLEMRSEILARADAEHPDATTLRTPRTRLVNFYPVRTGTDRIRWVGTVVVDTTQHKKSEEALRRSEKLAATGRLAASIAHEINNPLEAVTNLLYLLHDQPSLDSEAAKFADMAQHELARVSQITQQTLRFYRQSTQPTLTRLSEVLDSVLTLYRGRIHAAQIDVIRRYTDSAELLSFSGELRQLFANLVGNAIDAMSKGGHLTLTARTSRDWRNGRVAGVRIVVADTGSGMTEEVRQRIFEPFFTTKETTGTGLGLWVSAEIVEKHRGRVRVRSRVANGNGSVVQSELPTRRSGTVFMIFFPRHDGLHAPTTDISGK
ncbi:MAG TPA: ATP-binding protein [Acidobacteriaceae bacterium]|nr:ATP-binding protein [Acidobacteriaceae bacterium]